MLHKMLFLAAVNCQALEMLREKEKSPLKLSMAAIAKVMGLISYPSTVPRSP